MILAMQIHDAHTHFFSRAFFETLAKVSPRDEAPDVLIDEVVGKAGLELPSADTAEHTRRWLAEMDRAGVQRMVTFASLPPEAPVVAEAARQSGGRLVPYTVVDPSQDGAAAFVERALAEQGHRGLLLFPAMHHVALDDRRLDPILALADAHEAPVIVHCGVLRIKLRDLFGLPRPFDLSYANPLRIVPAANRFPRVPFVVPHFGGGMLRETFLAGMQCENVLVDSSSSNDWMRSHAGQLGLSRVFRAAVDALGHERILFGTDSSTLPRGWRDDIRDAQLTAMREAALTEDQMQAILAGNLQRLLPAR